MSRTSRTASAPRPLPSKPQQSLSFGASDKVHDAPSSTLAHQPIPQTTESIVQQVQQDATNGLQAAPTGSAPSGAAQVPTTNDFYDGPHDIRMSPNRFTTLDRINLNDPQEEPLVRHMSVLRIRLWIGFCAAFVILAPIIAIVMGITLHAQDMQYPNPRDAGGFTERTLSFEVVLIAADPKAGTMKLDWRVVEELNSDCSSTNLDACTEVNLFFDTNLIRAEGSFSSQEEVLNSDRPTRPIFRFNARGFAARDIMSKTATFRTQLALFSPGDHQSSLLFYPFDQYTSEIILFAQDARTNETVGVVIGNTRGIAVGFETVVTHRDPRDIFIPPGLTEAIITLNRSTLVKSYSVIATIAVWLVTMILALVMITSVFFGFKQKAEVLLIPVATLFAFTQLRQSMPGAPDGFGDVIDLVGLVPCLAILALSAAFNLGVFLLSDPSATKRELRWRNMQEAFPILRTNGNVKAG